MSLPPQPRLPLSAKPIATEPRTQDDDASDYSSDEDSSKRGGNGNDALDDWSEGESEEEKDEPVKCLFDNHISPTLAELKTYMQDKYHFDFRTVAQSLRLDFYGQMKLINFIRTRIAEKPDSASTLITLLTSPTALSSPELSFLFDGSESYLKPHDRDDALLFSLPKHDEYGDEEDGEEEQKDGGGKKAASSTSASASSSSTPAPIQSLTGLLQENRGLRNELEVMQQAMTNMQELMQSMMLAQGGKDDDMPDLATNEPAAASSSTSSSSTSSTPAASSSSSSSSSSTTSKPKPHKTDDATSGSFAPEHVDRDYFGGYSGRNIHELMLRDTIRTEAYRDFIYQAEGLFKDKIVLDVGCGTGILSMFAAKMGAKKVIGVDAAEIVHKAREIIAANGFSNQIEILHGKMEEVVLPVEKVDIIISEWMGYFLLFESMLPSVLFARNKYLREQPSASQTIDRATGVYPDRAIMYISGIETHRLQQEKIEWWKNVYGFNMECLVEEREKFLTTTVEIIRPDQVITNTALLKEIDVNIVKDSELDFSQEFTLTISKPAGSETLHPFTAFMVYFDTLFALHCKTVINLSTAPMKDHAPAPELTTHWQQSVFYLVQPLKVKEGDSIKGKLTAKRMKENPRAYDVKIEYSHTQDGKEGMTNCQTYKVQ